MTNRAKRPLRILVKSALDELYVAVREARSDKKRRAHNGIYLEPGRRFSGALPLNVRRGKATLGIHTNDDRLTSMQINGDDDLALQLLTAADEFIAMTEGTGTYDAREFVMWLLPEILGTAEHTKHQEARASLMTTGQPKGD